MAVLDQVGTHLGAKIEFHAILARRRHLGGACYIGCSRVRGVLTLEVGRLALLRSLLLKC